MTKTIICDNCKHEFSIEKLSERKWIDNGKKYREVWFNCPCCGVRFTCYNGVDKTEGSYVIRGTADEM